VQNLHDFVNVGFVVKKMIRTVVVALVGAAVLVFALRERFDQLAPQDDATVHIEPLAPPSGPDETSGASSSGEGETGFSAASAARRAISKSRPVNAQSDEDVRWMAARFYPTREEMSEVAALTGVALPEDLVPRSTRDLLIAQRALLDPARREDATTTLENGAIRGATFALVALGVTLEPISPIDSQAYFRAAVQLGDWSPALRYRPAMDHASDTLATLRSIQVLERIDAGRVARGLPRLSREVRPGLQLVIDSVTPNSRLLNPEAPSGG
jgi:hypothetical protein